jgi:hypothetical protein
MPADSVKRSAGITVSAIVAILGSIASLLLGMLMILTDVMRPSSSLPDQPASPIPTGVVVAIMATFYCGFGLWGIASASGLLRLKNWARLCFVIFGGLLAFFSLCTAAGTAIAAFVLPATTPLPENVPQGLVTGVFVFFAAGSLMCLAIAIWWLVYFNRATVKAAFAAEAAGAASGPRQFPVAVSIIAWVLIAGSVMTAVQMLFSYPLLIFGIVFRGLAASLLLAIFAAVGLAAGIGMLKRRAEAHSLAVGYCVFGILNVASVIVLPGSFARMQDVIGETQGSQALALPADAMYSFMVLGMLIGLVATSGMLWLLIRSRKPFVDACRLPVE